jgi:hypothetical protein
MPIGISGALLAVLGGLLLPFGFVVAGLVVLAPGSIGFGLVGLGLVGFDVFGRSWAAPGDVSPPISAIEKTHCDTFRNLNIDAPLALNAIYQSILHPMDASYNASCAKNGSFCCRLQLDRLQIPSKA